MHLEHTSVSGLYIIHDLLNYEEQTKYFDLLQEENYELTRSSSRRYYSYVPWETVKGKRVPKKDYPDLPNYAQEIVQKILLAVKQLFPRTDWSSYDAMRESKNTELQVNEYSMDSMIPFHHDDLNSYRQVIFGVSLGSDCYFTFQSPNGEEQSLYVPTGSLYLMSGASRFKWRHGVLPNCLVGGNTRISLTFRQVEYTDKPNKAPFIVP